MTASWLVADLAGDSSLLRGLDADLGSLMGLPAPSQLGGVFGMENSWTMGVPRAGAEPPAEAGPASFRGLAARLEAREHERQDGALNPSLMRTEQRMDVALRSQPASSPPNAMVRRITHEARYRQPAWLPCKLSPVPTKVLCKQYNASVSAAVAEPTHVSWVSPCMLLSINAADCVPLACRDRVSAPGCHRT